ncbi:MAG TPA: hypothetical protein DDY49_09605 [Paenibacillaceae bacterium]|nr:hypothetical protein [Paenibacillaceae bacterium]
MLKQLKAIKLCLLILVVFALAGCSGGSYRISVGDIKSLDNTISGSYRSFSGYYFKEVKLKKGQTVMFSITSTTEKGELGAKVIDSQGKTILEIKKDESLNISKSDTYKIQVEGKEHKGNFELSWKVQ